MADQAKNEVLTMQAIEERFPDEWVLLVNPEADKTLRIRTAELVFHSKDRDEVERVALQRRDRHIAILFTGKLPEDLVALL